MNSSGPTVDVVNFSGGRTSGYMLRRLQLEGRLSPAYHVLFCNTGKEDNRTLDFVHYCSETWDLPVTWLEYAYEGAHSFRVVDYATARRIGQLGPFDEWLEWKLARPGSSLPNPVQRSCSGTLKHKVMKRYLQSIGLGSWVSAIGIRADESLRTVQIRADCPSYITPTFPLVEWGVTEADVMAFWAAQSFDLGIEQYEGNCTLCMLKARWKRLAVARKHPDHARWWMEWEDRFTAAGRGNGSTWRLKERVQDLIDAATSQCEITWTDDEIGCSCMEGGWRGGEEDEAE